MSNALHKRAPRRVLVIFNPTAGRRRRGKLDAVVAGLSARGCAVELAETRAPGHATELARNAQNHDVIVAAGGDGTVNEVVNGLHGNVALGLIPLGTANVLADEVGMPRSAAAIAKTLAEGTARPIRIGVANGRRFVMMAGAGFDAAVVDRVSLALKRKLGPFAYVWETAKVAFGDSFAACEVAIDGVTYQTASAVVCNGRHYGGPFIAVPSASLDDDCFHTVLLDGRGWTSLLRYGVALMTGRLASLSDVRIVPGRKVHLNGVNGAPLQADGDIIARLPADITVDPTPLNLIVPA